MGTSKPLLLSLLLATVAPAIWGSPQFAREHRVRCNACHELVPRLNETGLEFQANGYRLPAALRQATSEAAEGPRTLPLAVWLTTRYEDKGSSGPSDLFLPKVELISGGRMGEDWSYFVEWRVVSLSLSSDGTLRDRGGRFEDLFFQWAPEGRHSLKLGQYRLLGQLDVSLRLSPSDPLLFNNGLRTGTDEDPRVSSLSSFSPSSRSPSVGYTFQSRSGSRAGDGLFHSVVVPFVGELSLPLSSEASETASFELADPKGLFFETFYRRGHDSIGAHAFIEDDAWLLTLLGTREFNGLFLTAGVGVDDPGGGAETRSRTSLEAEYMLARGDGLRSAVGLRVEEVSNDGKRAGWVPYFAVAAPNTRHTLLLQLQYRSQEGADDFVADLSLVF